MLNHMMARLHRMNRADVDAIVDIVAVDGGALPLRRAPIRCRRYIEAGIADPVRRAIRPSVRRRILVDTSRIGAAGMSRWQLDRRMIQLPASCRRVLVALAAMWAEGKTSWDIHEVGARIPTGYRGAASPMWRLARGGWLTNNTGRWVPTEMGEYAIRRIIIDPAWREAMTDA